MDIMDNMSFLKELKFGIGDGDLQYYLYNWWGSATGSCDWSTSVKPK